MTERTNWLKEEVQNLKDQNLFGELPVMETPAGPRIRINGKDVITLSSNNYLNFTNHPRVISAAKKAIDDWGFGTGAVRQINGTMTIHNALEKELRTFVSCTRTALDTGEVPAAANSAENGLRALEIADQITQQM